MYEIIGVVSKGDYWYAYVPDHPHKTVNGYVLHHRVVMENHLGRKLRFDELVHHKNENKKDNRVSNLEVVTHAEHAAVHRKGRLYVDLICPCCEEIFSRPKNQTHFSKPGQKYTACSKVCRGKLSRGRGYEQFILDEYRL